MIVENLRRVGQLQFSFRLKENWWLLFSSFLFPIKFATVLSFLFLFLANNILPFLCDHFPTQSPSNYTTEYLTVNKLVVKFKNCTSHTEVIPSRSSSLAVSPFKRIFIFKKSPAELKCSYFKEITITLKLWNIKDHFQVIACFIQPQQDDSW